MPKLGPTMEAGTIIRWLVADGAEVDQGVPVLLIETDKVEGGVEASGSGLLHIVGTAGENYACGEVIGWFLEPGEQPPVVAVAAKPTPGPQQDGRLLASPNARRVAADRGVDLSRVVGTGPSGRIVSEDAVAAPAGAGRGVSATTFAKELATELGIDLTVVRSEGADPRIDRADVVRHAREQMESDREPAPVPAEVPLLQEPSSTIPMTGLRGRIGERMHGSLQSMAQLTLTMEVDMQRVVEHRAASAEPKPGYTDYVIAATAAALEAHAVVNSQIVGGHLALLPEINVGMAVAIDGGLVVPVVHRADTLSLDELSAETTRLAAAARSGGLSLVDVEGGTFSVTALGMHGVDAFTPVINPPNTAILGVGRLRDGVQLIDGYAAPTTTLTLSLTWDHRAFDGVPAAEFTAAIRDRLEAWDGAT